MILSDRLKKEAIIAVDDVDEAKPVRATALLLLVGPVAQYPQIKTTAASLGLGGFYAPLEASISQVAEAKGGAWTPRQSAVEHCVARLKARVVESANIWMIHGGRSDVWVRVSDYVNRQLKIGTVEFCDADAPQVLITDRVREMASTADMAIAVMSSEDPGAGDRRRARQNVIHEIGLAQGVLGLSRVIIMREQGIEDFSNLNGLVYVDFAPDSLDGPLAKVRTFIESRLF